MPKIIIAGAGPVGLFTAICLKRRNPLLEVRLVEPHFLDYERQGIIAKLAVEEINRQFQALEVPEKVDVKDSDAYPANSVYIKDLQISLRSLATAAGVETVNARVEGLSPSSNGPIKTVRLSEARDEPCHLLIDCTGERRVMASNCPESFQVESIAENPIKTHFIAYVHMDPENAAKLLIKDDFDVADLETLRDKFGWQEFERPELVCSRWKDGAGALRCGLYFETPFATRAEPQSRQEEEAYLKALLQLHTKEDITFRVEAGPNRFNAFDVAPKLVSEPLNTTRAAFPIALIGDAHMSAEYRLGTGVRNGVQCAAAMMQSIEIGGADIKVRSEEWAHKRAGIVERHKSDVRDLYSMRRTKFERAAYEITPRYLAALETIKLGRTVSPADVRVLKSSAVLADRLSAQAQAQWAKRVDGREAIVRAGQLYASLYDIYTTSHPNAENAAQIRKSACATAAGLKAGANTKFTSGGDQKSLEAATVMYQEALHLYTRFAPVEEKSEIMKVNSNLGKTLFKRGQYKEAAHHFSETIRLARELGEPKMEAKATLCHDQVELERLEKTIPQGMWQEKLALSRRILENSELPPTEQETYRQKQSVVIKKQLDEQRPAAQQQSSREAGVQPPKDGNRLS